MRLGVLAKGGSSCGLSQCSFAISLHVARLSSCHPVVLACNCARRLEVGEGGIARPATM